MPSIYNLWGIAMIEKENSQMLQPLRIPAGWKITFNDFFMLDPEQYTDSDHEIWENFVEDLLYIVNEWTFKKDKKTYIKKIAIDLGWYPEMDVNGEFALYVIKDDDWDCPLAEFRSGSRREIVDTIEAFLKEYSAPCYYR